MEYIYLVGAIGYNSLPRAERDKQWDLEAFISKDQGLLLNKETLKIFIQRYQNIVIKLNRKYKYSTTWEVDFIIPSEQALSHKLRIGSKSNFTSIDIQLHLIKGEWKPV